MRVKNRWAKTFAGGSRTRRARATRRRRPPPKSAQKRITSGAAMSRPCVTASAGLFCLPRSTSRHVMSVTLKGRIRPKRWPLRRYEGYGGEPPLSNFSRTRPTLARRSAMSTRTIIHRKNLTPRGVARSRASPRPLNTSAALITPNLSLVLSPTPVPPFVAWRAL